MAPGITDAIKEKVAGMTENAKIADLQRDMNKSATMNRLGFQFHH